MPATGLTDTKAVATERPNRRWMAAEQGGGWVQIEMRSDAGDRTGD